MTPRRDLSAYNVTFEQYEELATHYERRREGYCTGCLGLSDVSLNDSRLRARTCTHARTHRGNACVLFACNMMRRWTRPLCNAMCPQLDCRRIATKR